jgi:hypothetical protein
MSLKSLGEDILKIEPNLKFVCKNGHVRFTPKTENLKLTELDHFNILKKANKEVLTVIPPKHLNSKSSKFYTYCLKDNINLKYVVFGLGVFGNEGMGYERKKADEIERYLETGTTNEVLNILQSKAGLVDVCDIVKNFNTRNDRPLDVLPKNVGKIIADIILKNNSGEEYYVSLKNITGKIMASHGITDSFKEQDNKIMYLKGQNLDLLLEELGVNTDKMINGLNDYISKNVSIFEKTERVYVKYPENVRDLIGAAHGYGYYLVKETKNQSCELVDLTTLENLNNYVGNIQTIELQYPYFSNELRNGKRKSMNIRVQTDKHKFQFVMRNRAGNLSPNTLELIKL